MSKIDLLKQWIGLLCYNDFDMYVAIKEEGGESNRDRSCYEHRFRCNIYTDSYIYTIVGYDRSEDNGYLGCVSSCRKSLPGEDWNRGRDLPDGPFTWETWLKILNGIIRHELVQLSEYIRSGRGKEEKMPTRSIGPVIQENEVEEKRSEMSKMS